VEILCWRASPQFLLLSDFLVDKPNNRLFGLAVARLWDLCSFPAVLRDAQWERSQRLMIGTKRQRKELSDAQPATEYSSRVLLMARWKTPSPILAPRRECRFYTTAAID
jgi:hypothetical protein